MPKFEVHIPPQDGKGFTVTLKVGADNWMSALKAGMQKLGEQGAVSQNVMVDIQDDNSIHVTEAASGRVFRIRELTEEEAARAQVKRPSQIKQNPTVPQRPEAKTDPAGGALRGGLGNDAKTIPFQKAPDLSRRPVSEDDKTLVPGMVPSPVASNATPAPGPGARPQVRANKSSSRIELKDVEELVQPLRPATGPIGRVKTSPKVVSSQRQETEDILADVFLRVTEIANKKSLEEAMDFIMDLILEKIPCESGAVFRSDIATGDLTFMVARGPKAKDILKSNIVIPAGTGIAGFCATEGVSVAINDVEKDPRFYAEVGERVGYATRSMLCAPMMTHGHSFGCVQVINRKGGPQFLEHEVGVIAYLAHQAALFLNQKMLE